MRIRDLTVAIILLTTLFVSTTVSAQGNPGDPRSNVNLIGMTPDPADFADRRYRQQNEPACAIRPGDSACMICAYNDYRGVDLDIGFGDSWQGVSQSCDAGDTWRSRLAPGYPGDLDAAELPAEFAADPRLAAIPGMAIFNFIAGFRDSNVGVLAIQHWLEVNKEDADHYEPGRVTYIADEGTSGRFLDKPDMLAVLDTPNRQGTVSIATAMENTDLGVDGVITRDYPSGTLYVAYAVFTGSSSVKVLVKTSSDWGVSWRNQTIKLSEDQNQVSGISLTAVGDKVLAVWRRKGDGNDVDSIMYSVISNEGKKATKGEVLADICVFDQPTLTGTETTPGVVTFRTNDFPWTANDGENFYVFYSDRGRDSAGACIADGRPRIVMHQSDGSGLGWSAPTAVDATAPADSFQFMPTAFGANGKVQVAWYDTRRDPDGDPLSLPYVADYEFGGTLTQRTVDVYTTNVTMTSSGPAIPAPVRASQFSIVVDEENDAEYETEASFANQKLFAQGQAPFLGDYIAMAAREFRKITSGAQSGKWESNASAFDGIEDFFVAWTDNRDVRGQISSIGESLDFSYRPETTAELLDETSDSSAAAIERVADSQEPPETGPPRDRSQTAEGIDGSDPNAVGQCSAETERTRDSNIYGSLIKDQLRLYAPTPSKPLSGLQRAFVVALTNSAGTPKTYDLTLVPGACQSGSCLASFRQKPSIPPFASGDAVTVETVTVPAMSVLSRTVFVVGNQDSVKVEARDGAQLVATIQLANSTQFSDPENCADPSCAVAENELHNLELLTVNASLLNSLMNADLLNANLLNAPLLVDWAVNSGCCADEDPATVGSVIEYAVENLAEADVIEPGLDNAALLNAALLNANLLNANLLNANLLNANLLNANLLNSSPTDLTVLDDALLDATAGCCGSNPTVGDIIVYAAELANANLLNANLLNAALLNVNLLNANLLNANLLNANLLNANLLNADLLNAALLNANLLNPDIEAAALLNANLLNADLLNANLLNPTLVALAVEGGCCEAEATPTIGSVLIYAVGHPETINASLLNAALLNTNLLNANLLNANLLNANLLNANLLNANLLNANLLNANLLNANLLNADLLNANLLNANLLNTSVLDTIDPSAQVTYDDYTYPVTNNGNVTTAIDADITINAPMINVNGTDTMDVIGTKLMTWTANATPAVVDCEDRVQLNTRVHSITGTDSNLEVADINNPFAGQVSAIVAPGETIFVTLRVIGTPEQLKNVRVGGFTASSQAANCVTQNGVPFCSDKLNEGIEQILFADQEPPVVTVPADITLEAVNATGRTVEYEVTVFDANDANPTLTCLPQSGDFFDNGETIVSCFATDASGNVSDSAEFKVIIADTTPPGIPAVPANISADAEGPDGSFVIWDPIFATDLVEGSIAASCSPASGSKFAIGATTVSCVATDSNGLTGAAATFTVTVSDQTPPGTPVVPADISVDAAGPAGSLVSWSTVSASDLVDGSVVADCSPTSGSQFALGTAVVSCSATDSAGLTGATATFNVTVLDLTPPSAPLVPLDIVEEASDANGATVDWGLVFANDIVDGQVLAACIPPSGSTFPLGSTPVTCAAMDAAGLTGATSVFFVNIQDTTAPTLPALADISVEATSTGGTPVSWTNTANDLVDGDIALSCAPASGSLFAIGQTTVNCSATDAASNSDATSFVVTVTDVTQPVIGDVVPPDGFTPIGTYPFELAANANTITVTWPINVTDADPNLAISCSIGGVPLTQSGSNTLNGDQISASFSYDFSVGTTAVVCTATDSASQTTTLQFNVEVLDVTPPGAPATPSEDLSQVEATGPSGATVSWADLFAEDAVDGQLTADCSPASGSTFALGTTAVSCTATDAAGLTSDASTFEVTVLDNTPPAITGVTPIRSAVAGPDGTASPTLGDGLIVTDSVDPAPILSCLPAGPLPFGETSVTCTATDAAGNSSSVSYIFNVTDETGPTITLTGPATVTLEAGINSYTEAGATASDNVDGDVSANIAITGTVDTTTVGTYTIYYDVSDNQGTAAETKTRTVVVQDTIAPVITVPASPVVVGSMASPVAVNYAVSVTDAGNPATTASCVPASGSGFVFGDTIVTCNANDGFNDADSATFTVRVRFAYDIKVIPPKGNTRAGSTIPLDWQYLDWATGSAVNSSGFNVEVRWALMTNSSCLVRDMTVPEGSSGPGDDSGNSGFRYSSSSNTWQYSWQTPTIAGYHKVWISPPGANVANAWKCVRLR